MGVTSLDDPRAAGDFGRAVQDLGAAGLGTVGSAVARMISRSRDQLAERAGRPIVFAAYAAKDPPKDSALDLARTVAVGEHAHVAAINDRHACLERLPEGRPRSL